MGCSEHHDRRRFAADEPEPQSNQSAARYSTDRTATSWFRTVRGQAINRFRSNIHLPRGTSPCYESESSIADRSAARLIGRTGASPQSSRAPSVMCAALTHAIADQENRERASRVSHAERADEAASEGACRESEGRSPSDKKA